MNESEKFRKKLKKVEIENIEMNILLLVHTLTILVKEVKGLDLDNKIY